MNGEEFLDTNVLIYATEKFSEDPVKKEKAEALARRKDFVISVQVIGEFYRASTGKRRKNPLTHEEAMGWIAIWKRHPVRPIDLASVDLALEIAHRYGTPYFDSLILATARLAKCSIVYSEDLSNGQDYGGVRVINPFA